jgi:hypothetical protein
MNCESGYVLLELVCAEKYCSHIVTLLRSVPPKSYRLSKQAGSKPKVELLPYCLCLRLRELLRCHRHPLVLYPISRAKERKLRMVGRAVQNRFSIQQTTILSYLRKHVLQELPLWRVNWKMPI